MKKLLIGLAALAVVGAVAGITVVKTFEDPDIQLVDLAVGAPAPGFTLPDANGKPVHLADFKGKTVVLEWNNPGCPFVKKQYDTGNMQKAQAAAAAQDVVWLTINSGAPGKQGHMDGEEAREFLADKGARPAAYLARSARPGRPSLRRADDPAHVRHQPRRQPRLRRRDRRYRRLTGGHPGRPQPCAGGAHRNEGGATRVRGDEPALWLQRQICGRLRLSDKAGP